MRADRLIALLLFLQSQGRVTAGQVAEELGISVSTARRDLEALSTAGVPVYVQPGRGGGWRLVGGARTNLTGLSGHEASALFWMLGTAGLSGPGTRLATRKLIRALPESLRDEAETLATTVHYDHAAWGDGHEAGSIQDADGDVHLRTLRSALISHRAVRFTYTHSSGSSSAREARPLGLVAKVGRWYLVARNGPDEGGQVRTFRVDRINDAIIVDASSVAKTDEFDLVGYWKEHVTQIDDLRSSVSGTIRAPAWTLPILRDRFGSYMTVISENHEHSEDSPDDGHFLAEVRANLVVALAEQLAGWGNRIEVLEPPELRMELARIGAELVAAYDG